MPKCGRFSEAEKRGICDNGVDFGKKKNKKTAKSKHPIRKKKKKEKIPTHQAQQHVTTVDRRRNGSRHVAKHVTKFGDITCQNT